MKKQHALVVNGQEHEYEIEPNRLLLQFFRDKLVSPELGVPRPPLSVAILDDPLQSLDDINLLGLVDLLRRTKDRRQPIVSNA